MTPATPGSSSGRRLQGTYHLSRTSACVEVGVRWPPGSIALVAIHCLRSDLEESFGGIGRINDTRVLASDLHPKERQVEVAGPLDCRRRVAFLGVIKGFLAE